MYKLPTNKLFNLRRKSLILDSSLIVFWELPFSELQSSEIGVLIRMEEKVPTGKICLAL